MLDADQRRLLGDFIRAHRERARPIAAGGRRRTPGLRREELATKAGISSTWCAWIEQGRPVQASPEALGRLARALSLAQAERAYLFELAGRLDPERSSEPEADEAAERLFFGWLDGDHQRNLLRFVFLERSARTLIPQWQDRARRLLEEFRADYGHTSRDARVRAFVDTLRKDSPLFAQAWDDQSVRHRAGGERAFNHPKAGLLCYQQHTFSPSKRPDYKLVMLAPVSGDGAPLPRKRTSTVPDRQQKAGGALTPRPRKSV